MVVPLPSLSRPAAGTGAWTGRLASAACFPGKQNVEPAVPWPGPEGLQRAGTGGRARASEGVSWEGSHRSTQQLQLRGPGPPGEK